MREREFKKERDGEIYINKTGLQPVPRPVELVHYFGGLVECKSPFGAKAFWREKKRIFDVNDLAGKNPTFRECSV